MLPGIIFTLRCLFSENLLGPEMGSVGRSCTSMGGSVTQTNTQIPITAKRNDLTSGTVREKLTEKLSKHQKLSLLYN